jgi:hypothetical protein
LSGLAEKIKVMLLTTFFIVYGGSSVYVELLSFENDYEALFENEDILDLCWVYKLKLS